MAWYDELVGDIKTALDAVYAPLSHNHNSLYYTKAEVDALIGGGTVTISLSADKSILSYYNSQSATLSATVLENGSPKESATVEFFKGSTSLGTASTNSSGVATKTYASTGAGDVSFTASVGSLVSETYSIEDCWYYNSNTYSTSNATLNVQLPNGSFSLEYILKQGATNSMPYLDIGNASNDRMLVGQYAKTGTNGLIIYKGTQTNYPYSTTVTTGVEHTVWFSYDGTNYNYKLDNGTPMTVADANVTLTKLIHIEAGGNTNNHLKNIKVKPL